MAINPAVNAPFSALPAPLVWSVDANGQSLAYVYGHADERDARIAKALTLDEARRIASNIAKLPDLTQGRMLAFLVSSSSLLGCG